MGSSNALNRLGGPWYQGATADFSSLPIGSCKIAVIWPAGMLSPVLEGRFRSEFLCPDRVVYVVGVLFLSLQLLGVISNMLAIAYIVTTNW